jgi:hypothetical protein
VPRGREALRGTSGGCLTGMPHVHWREGGETGGAGLRPGALVQPRDNTVDIDGSGGRDVLPVRFREPPIPRAAEPKRVSPLGERAFAPRAAPVLPLALVTRLPGLGGVQGLGLQPWVEFERTSLRWLRVRTYRTLRTWAAVLRAEAHLDKGMVRGAGALCPTPRGFALRTAHLLPLPIHRDLLERIGCRDPHLPALTRTCWAPQSDPVLVAAVDQQIRADRGGIDAVLSRRQLLVQEGLLDGSRTLRLMDGGRGRVDVREEVGGGGLAGFADMHHGAGP